jgi:hypothetical protein
MSHTKPTVYSLLRKDDKKEVEGMSADGGDR